MTETLPPRPALFLIFWLVQYGDNMAAQTEQESREH